MSHVLQSLKDFWGIPLLLAFSPEQVEKWGFTSFRARRFRVCQSHVQGRLLDIGCGPGNLFVRQHGNGVGIDFFPWENIDVRCDSTQLPFADSTFDTASILAALNHIPHRQYVLGEIGRVLRPGGILLITMIGPVTGYLLHRLIAHRSRDMNERPEQEGELWGMTARQIEQLFSQVGFSIVNRKRFGYGLNSLYVCAQE